MELFLTLPCCAAQTFALFTFVLSSHLHLRLYLAQEEHWELLTVPGNHQNDRTLCHLGSYLYLGGLTKPSGSLLLHSSACTLLYFLLALWSSHSHFLLHVPPFPRTSHFCGFKLTLVTALFYFAPCCIGMVTLRHRFCNSDTVCWCNKRKRFSVVFCPLVLLLLDEKGCLLLFSCFIS